MAVTDLYKAEVAFEIANLLAHDVAQGEGLHNTTLKHAECPGARPGHALQKAPAVDAILVQIFLDVIRHDLIPLCWHACVCNVSLCLHGR